MPTAESQVQLYADYEPERLMGFLVSSQSYGLEAAHELCRRKGFVREQVFVLGRMGNAREALDLIISRLGDVPQVDSITKDGSITAFAQECAVSYGAYWCLFAKSIPLQNPYLHKIYPNTTTVYLCTSQLRVV